MKKEMFITEDHFYQFNQLRERIGFIEAITQATRSEIQISSNELAAMFADIHQTLEQVCRHIIQLNE